MQRPGTLDYSRWDALDTSSSDDEAPRRMTKPALAAAAPPPPLAPPPLAPQPPAPLPLAPPSAACASTDLTELFLKALPVLLAHPTALAAASDPVVDALPDVPVLAKLPPALLASLRGVAAADTAPRVAARLACVCAGARGAAATLHLNDAPPQERAALLAIDRRRVAVSLVHGLRFFDEDGQLANVLEFAPTVTRVCNLIRDWPPPAAARESSHERYAQQMLSRDLHRLVKVTNAAYPLSKMMQGKGAVTKDDVVFADENPGALGQTMLQGCKMLHIGLMDMINALDDAELEGFWQPPPV
jgi:hypothetical protein